jgi:hypothetical protein
MFFSCDTVEEDNPVPTLTKISPSEACQGGDGFSMTLTWTNFNNSSKQFHMVLFFMLSNLT